MISDLLSSRQIRYLVSLSLVFLLAACGTAELDRKIASLNQQVTAERDVLAPLAAPYRGAVGKDVQFDVNGRPVEDTIEEFNKLGFNDRTMSLQSYRYSGYIAEGWTDCPWPFDGRIGFRVVPAFDEAFAAILHVDHIDHDWNKNDGLAFRLKNTLGAAGMIVGGRVELCGISGTVPVGLAAIALGAASAAGNTSLDPPTDDGITYRVRVTQPVYMVAYVATPVFSAAVPLWFTFELTKGKIPSVLGKNGSVQISETGQIRNYVLQLKFDQAAFLEKGLTAAGLVDVQWQQPSMIPSQSRQTPP